MGTWWHASSAGCSGLIGGTHAASSAGCSSIIKGLQRHGFFLIFYSKF